MALSSIDLLLESAASPSNTPEERSWSQAAQSSVIALEPESRTQQFLNMVNDLQFIQAAEWNSVLDNARVSDWSDNNIAYKDFVSDLQELSRRIVGPQVRVLDITTYVNTPGTRAIAFVQGQCLLADSTSPNVRNEGLWTLKWKKQDGEWRLSTLDLIKGLIMG